MYGGLYFSAYWSLALTLPPGSIPLPPVHSALNRPTVFLHSSGWPYERLAVLTTANQTSRSFVSMDIGRAKFTLSAVDPWIRLETGGFQEDAFQQNAFQMHGYFSKPDSLSRGNFVVITSERYPRPWVGVIVELDDNTTPGQVDVSCMRVEALLDTQPTPATTSNYKSRGAGSIFMDLIQARNAQGHSGVYAPSILPPGPVVDLDTTGQTTLAAFRDLHSRTGYEWWVAPYVVSPSRIEMVAQFGPAQGRDKSAEIIFHQGRDFADMTRILDTQGVRQAVTVYGAQGPVGSRPSVTRSKSGAGSFGLSLSVEPSSDLYNRLTDVPPALRTEAILFRPLDSSRTSLSMDAQRALERPSAALERYKLTLNVNTDWSTVEEGDIIRVVKSSVDGLGQYDRLLHVLGVQPDEEKGVMDLVVETPT